MRRTLVTAIAFALAATATVDVAAPAATQHAAPAVEATTQLPPNVRPPP